MSQASRAAQRVQRSSAVFETLEIRKLFAVGGLEPVSIDPGSVSTTLNVASAEEVVAAPTFSHERGFYTAGFSLTLTSTTPDATIRYTLDGTDPTATTGTVYTGPIAVSTTAVVRALAYKTDALSEPGVTHTYLFLNDVIRQPKTPNGYPTPRLATGTNNTVQLDYEMDPAIVNDPAYRDRIINGLKSIPTMMISVDKAALFGGGFYDTNDVEFPISMEYLDLANPGDNMQVNAGVEGHSSAWVKRSMRVKFKKAYGPSSIDSDLLRNAPVGGDSATSKIKADLVLRAGHNRSWATDAGQKAEFKTTFTEDEWARQNQIAVSGEGSHGTFVHLYVNGLYFGLYNVAERTDEEWGETYYGGDEDDWFSINHDREVKSGDPTRWNYLLDVLTTRDMSNAANYDEMVQYLDVVNFADYVVSQFYAGVSDWPGNNWWAGGDMSKNMPIKFFTWDAEYQMNTALDHTIPNGAWVHPFFKKTSANSITQPILKIWRALIKSPEFLTLFADRAQRAVAGPLSDAAALERLDTLNNFIKDAVIAEAARWGDVLEPVGKNARTPNGNWVPAVDAMRKLIPGNAARLIAALKAAGFFPSVNAPTLSNAGGLINAGFKLSVTNPNSGGTIYYTLDASDPRLPGGGLNPLALVYNTTDKITLNTSATVNVRIKNGSTWSALSSAGFTVESIKALRVSEMMYHPKAPEGSAIDKDEFEFIELKNTGPTTLNLSGVTISSGIDFTFGNVDLAPGAYVLVVRNIDAFESVHGTGHNIAGVYTGKLDNGGERIVVTAPGGLITDDFTYDDAWYPDTDGIGLSMEAVGPTASNRDALNAPAGWHAGPTGGTPGTGDATPPPDNVAPTANAGADQGVASGVAATLAGSASDDGLPAASLTYTWAKQSGPGTVTFANASALDTTASFSVPGVYVLELLVTDGELSATDTVTITVTAAPPPPATGSISGITFDDHDRDGVHDSNEPKTSNKTVYLDLNNNNALDTGEPQTKSSSAGDWAFTGLQAGMYYVRRVFPSGYTYSNAPLDITLAAGESVTGLGIGSTPITAPPPATTGSLSGFTFDDFDYDGVFDSNERKTSNKTVYLDLNNNGQRESNEPQTKSNAAGAWSFTGLQAGTYHVRRIFPSGYTYSNAPIDITLAAGQSVTDLAIGSKPTSVVTPPPPPPTGGAGSISGSLFWDSNRNAVRDGNEVTQSGKTVYLDTNNNGKLDAGERSTTTNSQGAFSFTNLSAGTYVVRRTVSSAYVITTPTPTITLATGQVFSGVLIGTNNA